MNDQKWEYEQDDQGRLASITHYIWSDQWWENARSVFEYGDDGLASEEVFAWDYILEWIKDSRFLATLDEHGMLAEQVGEYWNEYTPWYPWMKVIYTWTDRRGPPDYFDHEVMRWPGVSAKHLLYQLGFSPDMSL